MMRKVLALLVSGTIGLSGMSASWAQGAPSGQEKSVPAIAVAGSAKPVANSAPLAPGGAAGIRQAQGTGERIWNIIGIGFIAGVGLAMILIDGDDPETPTTGSN
jgi:hypothetical protein